MIMIYIGNSSLQELCKDPIMFVKDISDKKFRRTFVMVGGYIHLYAVANSMKFCGRPIPLEVVLLEGRVTYTNVADNRRVLFLSTDTKKQSNSTF